MQQECCELLDAKRDVLRAAHAEMAGNAELLQQLERRAGIPASDSDEAFPAFQAAFREHQAAAAGACFAW